MYATSSTRIQRSQLRGAVEARSVERYSLPTAEHRQLIKGRGTQHRKSNNVLCSSRHFRANYELGQLISQLRIVTGGLGSGKERDLTSPEPTTWGQGCKAEGSLLYGPSPRLMRLALERGHFTSPSLARRLLRGRQDEAVSYSQYL